MVPLSVLSFPSFNVASLGRVNLRCVGWSGELGQVDGTGVDDISFEGWDRMWLAQMPLFCR